MNLEEAFTASLLDYHQRLSAYFPDLITMPSFWILSGIKTVIYVASMTGSILNALLSFWWEMLSRSVLGSILRFCQIQKISPAFSLFPLHLLYQSSTTDQSLCTESYYWRDTKRASWFFCGSPASLIPAKQGRNLLAETSTKREIDSEPGF